MYFAASKPLWIARLIGLLLLCATGIAPAQSVKDGFNPNADGVVYVSRIQADGKILIGGTFGHIGGQVRTRLARLNADGSLDINFHPTIVGNLYSIAVQADGKILIGGAFTQVAVTPVGNIARLNSDGSLDTSFTATARNNANDYVYTIVVQGNGKILVGGSFDSVNNNIPVSCLARFNPDGSVDAGFSLDLPSGCVAPSFVSALTLQGDGRILVGGYFVADQAAFRLLQSGAKDPSFNLKISRGGGSLSSIVYAIAMQPDGQILLAGNFDQVNNTPQNGLARVSTVGELDAGFSTGSIDAPIYCMQLVANGDIVIGGQFTQIGTHARTGLARVTGAGSITSFNPSPGNGSGTAAVLGLTLQSDDEILIAGSFTTIGPATRNNIARVGTGGTLDDTLNLAIGGVLSIAVQADNDMLVGGKFTTIGSTARKHLARIAPDGSLGANYNPAPDLDVQAIAVEPDGSALIGGDFNQVGNQVQPYFAHLSSAGVLDTGFTPSFDSYVSGIALQPNGQSLVWGDFLTVNGAAHPHLVRLNPDGNPDTGFNTAPNDYLSNVAVQTDGRILIGGAFTHIGTTAISGFARLNSDGSIDSTFHPDTGGVAVWSIAVEPGGTILVSGGLGHSCTTSFQRLNTDGSLSVCFPDPGASNIAGMLELAGGKFITYGPGDSGQVQRRNADGSIDASFADLGADDNVYTAAITRDGKIAVGGLFNNIGGQQRNGLARFSLPEGPQQSLAVSGGTVTWLRSGSAQTPALPPILFYSTDFATYAPLGPMTAINGGWQYSGLHPLVAQPYILQMQAPGLAGANGKSGSSSIIQYSAQFCLGDEIFRDGFGN